MGSLGGSIPDFTQMTISLWFRVPQKDIDAAVAAFNANQVSSPPFLGIIPLLTFGPPANHLGWTSVTRNDVFPYTVTFWGWNVQPTCAFVLRDLTPNPVTEFGTQVKWMRNAAGDSQTEPSYIGIDCTGATPILKVNFQMGSRGQYSGVTFVATETPSSHGDYVCAAFGLPDVCLPAGEFRPDGVEVVAPIDHQIINHTIADYDSALFPDNELFTSGTALPTITADVWHHLLLSVDFSGSVSANGYDINNPPANLQGPLNSSVKLWIALDDQNLTALSTDRSPAMRPNNITTRSAFQISQQAVSPNSLNSAPFDTFKGYTTQSNGPQIPIPSYSFQPQACLGTPFGIPASSAWVNNIDTTQCAALQIFSGVTVDTTNTDARRAFITADGKPAKTGDATKFLASQPYAKLMSLADWQKGKNGLFTPTGDIDRFKPDAALNATGTAQVIED